MYRANDGIKAVFRKVFCIPKPITRPYSPSIPPSMASGGSDSNLATMVDRSAARKLEDSHYKPKNQAPYVYHGGEWISSRDHRPDQPLPNEPKLTHVDCLWVISWNIDFLRPNAEPRMAAALKYLGTLVEKIPDDEPVVILLQEMIPSDLKQIQSTKWVQEHFYVSDIDNTNWLSPLYGTTTLIHRSLEIRSVFRVPWVSKFDRDGLFVDLIATQGGSKVLRICNTHLESLVADPPVRPVQFKSASQYLHGEQCLGSIMAGDFNAIQPFDRTLHSEHKLDDAYLALGGREDKVEGYTWGFQSDTDSRKFGFSRMDKILFCGTLKPENFERIGKDIRTEPKSTEGDAKGEWVTDHYGLMAHFKIEEPPRRISVAAELGIP